MQKMEDIDTCTLCFETYEETSRPRILHCGHTYCTDCIGKLFVNGNPVCPLCNTSLSAPTATQLPINYALERSISAMKQLKENFVCISKSPLPGKIRTVQDVVDSQKLNVNSLLISSKAFDLDVSEYQKFLEASIQKNKDLANKLYKRAAWHESIVKLMLEEQKKAKDAQTQVALLSTNLKASADELDCRSGNEGLANVFHKLLDNFDNLSSCISRNKAEFPDLKISSSEQVALKSIEMIGEDAELPVCNKTECPSSFPDDHLTIMERLDSPMHQNDEIIVKVDEIRSKPNLWKRRIKSGKVFAVSTTGSCKRYASMSMKNDKVYLHCLQQQEIPPLGGYLIKHKELVSSAERDSMTAFLDWAQDGSPKGRIHIKMLHKSPLAKHFMALCTGELGPTYINKKFSHSSGMFIDCRPYNKMDMISGSDPLQLINLGDAMYNKISERGTTWLNEDGSFHCNVTMLNGAFHRVFGKAQDELNLLSNTLINHPGGNITVIDSGIILEA